MPPGPKQPSLIERLAPKSEAEAEARADRASSMEAGIVVRRMRKRAGFSQVELARRVGTSQEHISQIESGKGTQGPTIASLMRIARVCNDRLLLVPDSERDELRPRIDNPP